MEQVLGECDEVAIALATRANIGSPGSKKRLPGRPRDLVRKRRLAGTSVERVVAVPEWFPGGKIGLLDGTDDDWAPLRAGASAVLQPAVVEHAGLERLVARSSVMQRVAEGPEAGSLRRTAQRRVKAA